ncbi:unnamed protein product [Rhizoctonia solani]|uniref:MYND-type domain-containing protein n=1 Tax=Rhizoctonia solani TaxID=456999 RepID=A0A8H3AE79_9AGAM|nr:unnamed protein product [Rhizoctonia solani]
MLTALNNDRHGFWGRSFPGYFKSYTNQAVATPLSPLEEPQVRTKAAKTVEWIIALGRTPRGDRHGAARYITLSMLKSILDATKIPEEIKRLADLRLIPGCVGLITSVEPVFGYEYGYVCFRILNFAIGACLLKQIGRLDDTIERMRSASDGHLVFWSDAAAVVYWDIRHAGRIILGLCLIFTEDSLDRLMNLLHDNQKQYFIVLKALESMGLSGLMLTLRAHIQVRGVVMSNKTKCGDLVESRIQPYSRLLWRYLLSVPTFIEHEVQAVYEIHIDVTYWARFRESYFIDVEDSRNLLQALNEKLVTSSMTQLTRGMILLRFVEPLVVPGCENLVPTLVERCLRLMWNAIENNDTCSSTARVVITTVLMSIRYIFQEIKPKSFDHQQWIVQLVDTIINESPTDLILRVLITAPDFVPGQQDVTERLCNIASEFYEDLVYLVPRSYFISRLRDSGVLADWHKYVNHFLGEDTLEAPTGRSLCSSRNRHDPLGRRIPDYFKSYTNQALSVLLSPYEVIHVQVNASKTIERIIALGDRLNPGRDAARYIPLSMLKSVLDMTKIPTQIQKLADPRLVTGCIELMAFVKPLFEYEYGYVCFRILNLAINACILKCCGRLNDTIQLMSYDSGNHLPFWSDAAAIVCMDIKNEGHNALRLCAGFPPDALDRLIELLHSNQKQYFIVLRNLQSMGLSGLMLILRAHIRVGELGLSSKVTDKDLAQGLVQPYSRLLWRYLLAVPVFIEYEAQAIYEVHIHITYWARFRDSYFVDVQDSRNLLQALNQHFATYPMTHLTGGMVLLRFVEPLVVRGCEDLIPTLVKCSLRSMWDLITTDDGPGSSTLRVLVTGVLTSIRYIFQEIRPKSFDHQQWIVELVDSIIDESLTNLVLRVLVAAPDFVPGQQDLTERLYNAASQLYEELVRLAPNYYLVMRLDDSGLLDDWHKYTNYFFGTGDVLRGFSRGPVVSAYKACGEVILHTLMAVLGIRGPGTKELYSVSGSCDNPRCPMPCGAMYVCSECEDLEYCSERCLIADWASQFPGLHKRVCTQQALANRKLRSTYHQTIEDPGRKKMTISQKNDMDTNNMVLSYSCDNVDWVHL